jgi:hypothetical protein
MTISELRKKVKELGYKLTISTLYYGKHADFYKGKEVMPSIFAGKDHLESWKPLLDFLKTAPEVLDERGGKVYGVKI